MNLHLMNSHRDHFYIYTYLRSVKIEREDRYVNEVGRNWTVNIGDCVNKGGTATIILVPLRMGVFYFV